MKKLLIGAAVVVAIAGAGYYGLAVYPDQRFRSELDAQLAALPEGVSARYETAHYDALKDRATITGLTIDAQKQPEVRVRIDRIDLDEPGLDAGEVWKKAEANPEAVDPATVIKVASSIELAGVTADVRPLQAAEAGTVHYEIASLDVAGLRVFPRTLVRARFGEAMANMEALMQSGDESPADPEAVLKKMEPLLHYYAALYLGLAYDSYRAEKLTMTARPDGEAATATAAPPPVNVTIASMSAEGFDRGISGPASVTDMKQTVAGAFGCSIARIDLKTFDVRDLSERVLGGAPFEMAMLDKVRIDGFAMDRLDCSLPDGEAFAMERLSLGDLRFAGGALSSGRFSLAGLKVPLETLEVDPGNSLLALDLEAITVSAGLAFQLDPATLRLEVSDVSVAIAELGRVELAASLDDVVPGLEGAGLAKLVRGRIDYTDASLAGRMLEKVAAQHGVDVDTVRQGLIDDAPQQLAAMGLPAELAGAVVAFLRDPRSLHIELAPPAPVALSVLEGADQVDPADLYDLLGISVTANR